MTLFNKDPMAMLEDNALVVMAIMSPEWHKHCVQWKQWAGADMWVIVVESRCEEESGFCLKCTTNALQSIHDSALEYSNNYGGTQDIFCSLPSYRCFLNVC